MKLKNYILIILFVIASFIFISSTSFTVKSDETYTYISYLKWYNSYDDALKIAKKENKPIIIYFWATWCKWCKLIEGEVFVEPKINNVLNDSFVRVAVNVDYSDKKISDKFNTYNSGVILLVDKYEKPITSVGYMQPSEFHSLLKHVLEIIK